MGPEGEEEPGVDVPVPPEGAEEGAEGRPGDEFPAGPPEADACFQCFEDKQAEFERCFEDGDDMEACAAVFDDCNEVCEAEGAPGFGDDFPPEPLPEAP